MTARIDVDRSVFVTGTDTGVGKTHVSVRLLRQWVREGHRAAGLKPLAAGAHWTAEGWRNEDALALAGAGSVPCTYEEVNPICLQAATAPHLAAAAEGRTLELGPMLDACHRLAARAGRVVVEGAGGWYVPLAAPPVTGERGPTLADLAQALGLPVLLVVGIRLGALNHALLTAEALRASGLPLAGWVANCCDPGFADAGAYVADLDRRLPLPRVGLLAYGTEADGA